MSDLQQQLPDLIQAVAVAAIEGLPPTCSAAQVRVTVETRSGKTGMSVFLVDVMSGDQLTCPAGLPQPVMELYRAFAEAGQPWKACEVDMKDEGGGNWNFNLNFDYDENSDRAPASPAAPADAATPEFDPTAMSAGFRRLLNQHAAMGSERQMLLEEIVGGRPWQLDLEHRQLGFEGAFQCRVDLLGSVSSVSHTWLWAWANDGVDAPEAAVAAAKKIRQLGEEHDVWEFTTPQIELGRVHPELLGWVLAGLLRADFHYWGEFDAGAALVVGHGSPIKDRMLCDVARVCQVLPQVLTEAGEHLDCRPLCLHYLRAKGYKGAEEPDAINAVSPDGEPLRLEFDNMGRLAKLEGRAG